MDSVEALERLARLRDSGALTEAEFQSQKTQLLSGTPSHSPTSRPNLGNRPQGNTSETEIDAFRGSTTGWLFGSFSGWLTLLLCLVGVGLLILLGKWWGNIGTRYELTSQRLKIRTGIFVKRVDEIELYRVRDVRVDFSLLNQITDIGNITLTSTDATSKGKDFRMIDLPKARERRETLRSLVDVERQRRGVREMDVGSVYI